MTDQTTEIDAEGMRCLLVAMGARPINVSQLHFIGFSAKLDWWVTEGHRLPAFVLACLRFLESERVRAKVLTITEMWMNCATITTLIDAKNSNGIYSFTDPDPAVRIVKAAIAASMEMSNGK